MHELASYALLTLAAIFFVVDPFAVIPLFLSITRGDDLPKKRRTALRAAIATTVTLLAFALTGSFIFQLFHVTLAAFRIAGGVLLFMLGLEMIRAQTSRTRSSPEELSEGQAKEEVAIIPLAIPMLSGPGSIAMVVVLMSQTHGDLMRGAIVLAAILVTGALTYLVLRSAVLLERVLKQTGLNILNRLMGLLLAAMAVQFIIAGVADAMVQILPALAERPAHVQAASAPVE